MRSNAKFMRSGMRSLCEVACEVYAKWHAKFLPSKANLSYTIGMKIEDLVNGPLLEDTTHEFKGIIKEGPDPKNPYDNLENNWLKEMVAFANTLGGELYIGVDNKTHQLLAFDSRKLDEIILMIQRLTKSQIEPNISYEVKPIPIGDRFILLIKVAKSPNAPVALKFRGFTTYYIRHFGYTSPASTDELRSLVINSESVSLDFQLSDRKFAVEDFSLLFDRAKAHLGRDLSEKELLNCKFFNKDRILYAGALFFLDDCDDERARLVCTHYAGLNKGANIARYTMTYQGNLIRQLEQARDFVLNRSENGFVKGPDSSIPFIAYPTRSVTEAIANGVGHRNYFLVGTQIEVNLFDDRLEVISPGSLFTSSEHLRNEKNLASLIPGRRNNLICSLLSFCGYMDIHGTGLDKIIEEYKPYGDSYAPFANSDTNYFSLTLLNLTYDRKKLNGSLPLLRIDGDLTEREQKILSYCYYEPKSISEIADFLKIKPSTYLRRSIIGSLVMGGYLLPLNSDGKALFRTSHEKAILL